MRRILGFILVLCMVFTVLSGLAEETAGTAGNAVPTLEEMKARIEKLEGDHPEMESLFPALLVEVQAVYRGEMRTAFANIQARFSKMLEEDREKAGAPENALQGKRETLNLQASLLNANYMAHMRKSFDRMVAELHNQEYKDDRTVMEILKDASAELEATGDEASLKEKARLDKILETVGKEYDGDLYAYYKTLFARPELPPEAAGQPKDVSHPEPPADGEKPADGDGNGIAFKDHFDVIYEEVVAAEKRIDTQLTELANTASEKYQIPEEAAGEAFGILNDLFRLINEEMIKQLKTNEGQLFS